MSERGEVQRQLRLWQQKHWNNLITAEESMAELKHSLTMIELLLTRLEVMDDDEKDISAGV